jgi:2-methylisocitrate lyase-like PEP mutase family enzyme
MGADRASADAELQRIIDQWGPETAERLTGGALTGLADDALERIGAYRDAGADLVNIALRLPVVDEALEVYLTDLVPQARAAWAS